MRGPNGRWLTHPLLMDRWPCHKEDAGGRKKAEDEKAKVDEIKEAEQWLSSDTPFCVILDKSGSDGRWQGREWGTNHKEQLLCFTLQWALCWYSSDTVRSQQVWKHSVTHRCVSVIEDPCEHCVRACVCVFNSLINYLTTCHKGNRICLSRLPPFSNKRTHK